MNVKKENEKYAFQIEADELRKKQIDEGQVVDEQKGKNKFAELFKEMAKNSSDAPVIENVVLYQNDFNKFFDAGEEKRSQGYSSYAFEKACLISRARFRCISIRADDLSVSRWMLVQLTI